MWRSELREMILLAVPVVLSELGWVAQGVVDNIMVGRLGPVAIGAVALGNAVYYTPSLFWIGLLLGLDTLVSQAFGRRDHDMLSIPIGPREHMVRDYATLSQRRLDVRIPAQTTSETEYTIKVPASAKIAAMPGASNVPSPFGTFQVAVDPVPGGVRVKTSLTMTKTRIPVAEYAAFRKWCETIDGALGQRLIVTVGGK